MMTFDNITTDSIYHARHDFLINNTLEFTTDSENEVVIGIRYGINFADYMYIRTLNPVVGLNTTIVGISGNAYNILFESGGEQQVQIEIQQEGISYNSPIFLYRHSSLEILKPNTSNNTGNHNAIHYKSYCNIIWNDTDKEVYPEVEIEISKSGINNWISIIPSQLSYKTKNKGQYIFRPFDYYSLLGTPAGVFNLDIRISVANESIYRYHTMTTTISNNEADCVSETQFGGNGETNPMDYPDRFDTYARIAGEKAKFLDEAILKGQLEPGRGIRIVERDLFGIAPTDHWGDVDRGKSAAYNLVVETDFAVPRTLYAQIELTNVAANSVYQESHGYAKYGTLVYADIIHNWNIGIKDSYVLDYTQVARGTAWDSRVSECYAMPLTENIIRVFGVKKNNPNIFSGAELTEETNNSMKFNVRISWVNPYDN